MRRPAPPRSRPRSTGRSATTTSARVHPDVVRSSRSSSRSKQWYDLLVTSEDPDTRRQAAEALGYELPDPEGPRRSSSPPSTTTRSSELRTRQQALEERLNQEQEAMRMAYRAPSSASSWMNAWASSTVFPRRPRIWILAYAVNALPAVHEPGVPVPLPDLAQAHQAWQELQTEAQQSWAKTKRAPVVMPGGVTADQVPDPGTHEGRVLRRCSVCTTSDRSRGWGGAVNKETPRWRSQR
jgi:hypothetical protein